MDVRLSGRAWRAAVTVLLVAALAACNLFEPLDPSLEAGFLTPEADDDYGLTIEGDRTIASAAASNVGGNTRVAFSTKGGAATVDQESCATWSEVAIASEQPGAALRVRTDGGAVRAITVTQNVVFQVGWIFNVHVMDSSMKSQPFTQIAGFDMATAVVRNGGYAPLPWRLCARAVGGTVSFKVWPVDVPEPSWDDPAYAGSVALPAGWNAPGTPGWYAGHLAPGQTMVYTERTVAELGVPAARSATASGAEAGVAAEPTTAPRAPTDIASAP